MNLPENTLSRAQEGQCVKMRWHGKLIEANLREAVIYLKRIAKGRFNEGELVSFAYDGMVQAVKNYDAERNRFFTWAKPHIRGKMFAAMRAQSRYAEVTSGGAFYTEVVKEDPETGVKEDMPRWTNEPSVEFNHEELHYRTHYLEEIAGVMKRVLRKQEQQVVYYRIWHDLRYREIGEKLKFSTSRAQAIFERAMQLVRRELMRRKRLNDEDNLGAGLGD